MATQTRSHVKVRHDHADSTTWSGDTATRLDPREAATWSRRLETGEAATWPRRLETRDAGTWPRRLQTRGAATWPRRLETRDEAATWPRRLDTREGATWPRRLDTQTRDAATHDSTLREAATRPRTATQTPPDSIHLTLRHGHADSTQSRSTCDAATWSRRLDTREGAT